MPTSTHCDHPSLRMNSTHPHKANSASHVASPNQLAPKTALALHRLVSADQGKQVVMPYCGYCNTTVGHGWLCKICNDRCPCGRIEAKGDICERCFVFCQRHDRHYLKPYRVQEHQRAKETQAAEESPGDETPNPMEAITWTCCEECAREQNLNLSGSMYALGGQQTIFPTSEMQNLNQAFAGQAYGEQMSPRTFLESLSTVRLAPFKKQFVAQSPGGLRSSPNMRLPPLLPLYNQQPNVQSPLVTPPILRRSSHHTPPLRQSPRNTPPINQSPLVNSPLGTPPIGYPALDTPPIEYSALGYSPLGTPPIGQSFGHSPLGTPPIGQSFGHSPLGTPPIGQSFGHSPLGTPPIGQSFGHSPLGTPPIGQSVGHSPLGTSPVGPARKPLHRRRSVALQSFVQSPTSTPPIGTPSPIDSPSSDISVQSSTGQDESMLNAS
ncbi:hypothetical protein BC936DRAFT_136780 [Jimgerdemannia flammicorona]|uniref:Uncharacterized protein n=1 Tax=Jimgerdemannia flammicorona TaxID=994334 RepID=A0A433DJC3_9FUNG|nr:hypothetical protein BC936DRAFT_136780 [Jimgerdemannia flammicorona]